MQLPSWFVAFICKILGKKQLKFLKISHLRCKYTAERGGKGKDIWFVFLGGPFLSLCRSKKSYKISFPRLFLFKTNEVLLSRHFKSFHHEHLTSTSSGCRSKPENSFASKSNEPELGPNCNLILIFEVYILLAIHWYLLVAQIWRITYDFCTDVRCEWGFLAIRASFFSFLDFLVAL